VWPPSHVMWQYVTVTFDVMLNPNPSSQKLKIKNKLKMRKITKSNVHDSDNEGLLDIQKWVKKCYSKYTEYKSQNNSALAYILYLYELYWLYILDKVLRDMRVAKLIRT